MKTFLVLILTLTGTHSEVLYGPDMVTGVVERTVTIPCSYDKQYRDNIKYWCAGRLRSSCVKTASTDGSVTDSRVSIRDEKLKGVFYITINSLMKEDKGWYQCVIKRSTFIIDDSHNVYLNISIASAAVVPTAGGLQTSPEAKFVMDDSSVAEVWAVMRWVLFSLMLACFFTVTWWKRSTCCESAPAAAPAL